jgi:hypothetical protein
MTRTDILEELNKLPPDEQLDVVESALHRLREQLQSGKPVGAVEWRERLSIAADALKTEYETDGDLTAFTTLDADDFHAAR